MAFLIDSVEQLKLHIHEIQIESLVSQRLNAVDAHNNIEWLQLPGNVTRQIFNVDDSTPYEDNSNSAEHPPSPNSTAGSKYPGVLDTDLLSFTIGQRNAFLVIIAMVSVLSLCGNISTLFVNPRRKIRPLFRVCIISLALSDIMNTLFTVLTFHSKCVVEYIQLWILGPLLCRFSPFMNTTTILASSLTLVGIALDRFYALKRSSVACWKPSLMFGVISTSCIWIASIAISCPVLFLYRLFHFYIVTLDDGTEVPSDESLEGSGSGSFSNSMEWSKADYYFHDLDGDSPIRPVRLVTMCATYRHDIALYYVIVFSIIFVPCIVAFVWLNLVIAGKIWQRRRRPGSVEKTSKIVGLSKQPSVRLEDKKLSASQINLPNSKQNEVPSEETQTPAIVISSQFLTVPTLIAGSSSSQILNVPGLAAQPLPITESISRPPSPLIDKRTTRKRRHIRMVKTIMLLLMVFIFLRLPAWIFLVMRMYGAYNDLGDWILYFVFGIFNLVGCALSPIFYTFLGEALEYISYLKDKFLAIICCRCCTKTQEIPEISIDSKNSKWDSNNANSNNNSNNNINKNKNKVENFVIAENHIKSTQHQQNQRTQYRHHHNLKACKMKIVPSSSSSQSICSCGVRCGLKCGQINCCHHRNETATASVAVSTSSGLCLTPSGLVPQHQNHHHHHQHQYPHQQQKPQYSEGYTNLVCVNNQLAANNHTMSSTASNTKMNSNNNSHTRDNQNQNENINENINILIALNNEDEDFKNPNQNCDDYGDGDDDDDNDKDNEDDDDDDDNECFDEDCLEYRRNYLNAWSSTPVALVPTDKQLYTIYQTTVTTMKVTADDVGIDFKIQQIMN